MLSSLNIDKRKTAAFSTRAAIIDEKEDRILGEFVYLPKRFPPQILSDEVRDLFTKQANGRYHYALEFENVRDKFSRANHGIVDFVSDEKGAEQMLRLIRSIPQLKFRLTVEQERMISTPSNLLCLGRSGTGKTTSSALRLFSTDVFYKYMDELRRFKVANPDALNQDFKVEPRFLSKSSQLRLVFVTFSPVLTNEVQKFYNEMREHFTNELVRRREKAAKQHADGEEKKSYELQEDYLPEDEDA